MFLQSHFNLHMTLFVKKTHLTETDSRQVRLLKAASIQCGTFNFDRTHAFSTAKQFPSFIGLVQFSVDK